MEVNATPVVERPPAWAVARDYGKKERHQLNCFAWHLRQRLDHILYSDELELVDVKVIEADLSDHKPLMARFVF